MKNIFRISGVILLILSIILIHSCKKEEIPTLTTTAVSNITATTATSGGNITAEGSSTITSRGVCWSTGTTPTIDDSKTTDGAGAGSFSSSITGLNGATVYYVRAYATNSVGTGYGMALSFTTLGQSPTPAIAAATNINVTSATLNGSVNANYLSTVVTFEYGTTTSYGSTTTSSQSPVTGNTVTNVSSAITGLTAATIYHYRIKAVNSLGTTNSDDITFTTLGQIPIVTTLAATIITTVAAQFNGIVNANYLSTTVTFEYGTTVSYGNTLTATQSPVSGNSVTNVSANITGLAAGTIYHFRVKAVNSLGTSNGSDLTFTTLGLVPTATTLAATNINSTGATMNGTVNANYLSTIVSFEYGTSTSYGSTAMATQSPVTGNTVTNITASITGLIEGTIYHFRVKAVNSLGKTYGNDMIFTTKSSTTITDIEGNMYNIVTIGTQVWMAENLKTTKYNDGTSISYVPDNALWIALKTPDYCWYDNEIGYIGIYGAMYNWYVVDKNNNGNKNVCPVGWHVPATTEWQTLVDFLGGESLAVSNKLRETGTIHWSSPNTGATNESGFTALPGGIRDNYGNYRGIHNGANWWSTLEWDSDNAWMMIISTGAGLQGNYKILGNYVRCIKD